MQYFIAGGAGFIGSNLAKRIIEEDNNANIIIYDNFSSGDIKFLDEIKNNNRVSIIYGDIKDLELLTKSMKYSDIVYHFASNPDIAKAMIKPNIDFWEGTYLTNNILEAMRINNVKKILYASGSGIYGDYNDELLDENHSPNLPISTYGASKLACEAMICSYCYLFDIDGFAFRFANVVGGNQTHGVGYDFIRKLNNNREELDILGDGTQSKSYIYIDDIINAIRTIEKSNIKGYDVFNVSNNDYISVKDIADITCDLMGLNNVKYNFADNNRGWKGDIPIVRLDSHKIEKYGWRNKYSSYESILISIEEMINNF